MQLFEASKYEQARVHMRSEDDCGKWFSPSPTHVLKDQEAWLNMSLTYPQSPCLTYPQSPFLYKVHPRNSLGMGGAF